MGKVNYYRTTINQSIDAFSLEGCINPVFQNMGDAPVLIDGVQYDNLESFPIHTNGLPFDKNNNITIQFLSEINKNLVFRCVKVSENCK